MLGGRSTERRKRSIPLVDWREMLTLPGVQFVNLQYSDSSDELAQVQQQFGVEIHDWEDADPLVDLDSFAAKIAALDLVISVGNATVHLAGAVGTPAWTMLPKVPSWRWMIEGDESPWYGNVRLFRQSASDDWQPVLSHLAELLRDDKAQPPQGSPYQSLDQLNVCSMPPRLASAWRASGSLSKPAPSPSRRQECVASQDQSGGHRGTGAVAALSAMCWGDPSNDDFLDEPLERAKRHREAGEFADAESIYRTRFCS